MITVISRSWRRSAFEGTLARWVRHRIRSLEIGKRLPTGAGPADPAANSRCLAVGPVLAAGGRALPRRHWRQSPDTATTTDTEKTVEAVQHSPQATPRGSRCPNG